MGSSICIFVAITPTSSSDKESSSIHQMMVAPPGEPDMRLGSSATCRRSHVDLSSANAVPERVAATANPLRTSNHPHHLESTEVLLIFSH
jgi:hypothetical protein